MDPRDFTQRRRILFTMLTALTFRYPPGHEPSLIAALRQWLGGWRWARHRRHDAPAV
jgi:hypothetical protein